MKLRLIAALAMTGLAATVLAVVAYVKLFNDTYGIAKNSPLDKAKCAVCHVGNTKKLNPYGIAMEKQMEADKSKKLTAEILRKLDNQDSDGDGFKNIDEIKAGTLPGDPKSKPK